METKLVYRVEDERGYGPFNTVGAFALDTAAVKAGDIADREECYHNTMPCPYEDGIEWNPPFRDSRCGAATLADLGQWFTPAMCRLLDENGHRLTIWEVPAHRVKEGGVQVVFDRANSRRIAARRLRRFRRYQ